MRWTLCLLALAACDDAATTAADSTAADATADDSTQATDTVEDASPEVVENRDLYPGMWRLDGLDPTSPTDDLAPLIALVGDADIIGLGESVHTSGGFYAAKDRIIRALVSEHGLRLIAIESPRTPARRLDEYIQSGPCDVDPIALFDGAIFGVFVDDNTVDLFRWLCGWNATHATDKVSFFGFDAQQPTYDEPAIATFVATHAPERSEATAAFLTRCADAAATAYPEADYSACMGGIDALEDAIVDLQLVPRMRAEIAMTLRSLRSWQDQTYFTTSDPKRSWEARDVAMADLFEAQMALDHPDRRVIMWAHNYHLAADHTAIQRTNFIPRQRTLGSELRARRGAAYAPVAITAHRPAIVWPGISDEPSSTEYGTQPGSLEATLHELRSEAFIVYDPASDWIDPTVERYLSEEKMFIGDNFDAVLYLRESPAMDALFW